MDDLVEDIVEMVEEDTEVGHLQVVDIVEVLHLVVVIVEVLLAVHLQKEDIVVHHQEIHQSAS